jgi:protein-tyrosine-phosphatase
MPSILFVCTANQFRSPIAAACLLKNIDQENTDRKWIIESAGTWARAGLPVPDIALQIADQLGLDRLDSHLTRQIDQKLLNKFDLIIVMEIGHKEAICSEFPSVCGRLYLLSEIVDGFAYDIPDPAKSDISTNDIGRELYMLITKGKGKILRLAETLYKSRSPERGNY